MLEQGSRSYYVGVPHRRRTAVSLVRCGHAVAKDSTWGEGLNPRCHCQRDPALRAGGEVAFSEGELLLLECTKACDGCCWRLRLLGVAVFRTQSYN